jgi:hypothetical protein
VDIDHDGDIDLVAFNGFGVSTVQRNALYRNDGNGSFTALTAGQAGALVSIQGNWVGGIWGDVDNDGDEDCVATDGYAWPGLPMNLFLNNGVGYFINSTTAGALVSNKPSGGGALADYDIDGWLDVFLGCAWSDVSISTNRLLHCIGDALFEEVATGPIPQDQFVGAEGQVWSDYDGDGDPDLLVTDPHAWSRNPNASPLALYRNDGNGQFTRVTEGVLSQTKGSVLIPAWADYDNDGRMDVFLSLYEGDSRLLHNEGNGEFSSKTISTGPESDYPAWGDFDNDGDLDLMVSTGQFTSRPNRFFLNQNGALVPHTLGSLTSELGTTGACLWGDFNNDGFLDMFFGRFGNQVNSLFRNNTNGNRWLMVSLEGKASNRSAIGAKVRVTANISGQDVRQMREISGGNRHQCDPRAHFGLGDATNVTTLRIEWPSGIVQELQTVAANTNLTIVESQSYTNTNAIPNFTGAVKTTGGVELSFSEPATNAVYILEASTNLIDWTKLVVRTSAGVTTNYMDTRATNYTKRFYRILVP